MPSGIQQFKISTITGTFTGDVKITEVVKENSWNFILKEYLTVYKNEWKFQTDKSDDPQKIKDGMSAAISRKEGVVKSISVVNKVNLTRECLF